MVIWKFFKEKKSSLKHFVNQIKRIEEKIVNWWCYLIDVCFDGFGIIYVVSSYRLTVFTVCKSTPSPCIISTITHIGMIVRPIRICHRWTIISFWVQFPKKWPCSTIKFFDIWCTINVFPFLFLDKEKELILFCYKPVISLTICRIRSTSAFVILNLSKQSKFLPRFKCPLLFQSEP